MGVKTDPRVHSALDLLADHLQGGDDRQAILAAGQLLALLMAHHLSPSLTGYDITMVQEGLGQISQRQRNTP